MINRDRLVKRFCDLVQIDSPSGEEEAVAVELVKQLEALGLSARRDGYGNIIANDGRPSRCCCRPTSTRWSRAAASSRG